MAYYFFNDDAMRTVKTVEIDMDYHFTVKDKENGAARSCAIKNLYRSNTKYLFCEFELLMDNFTSYVAINEVIDNNELMMYKTGLEKLHVSVLIPDHVIDKLVEFYNKIQDEDE